MTCFLRLLKLNGKLLENQARLQKRKRKQKYQCLNLKVSRSDIKFFSIEDNRLKANFKTSEKDFYQRMFQPYITGEDKPNKIIFHVTIGSFKK